MKVRTHESPLEWRGCREYTSEYDAKIASTKDWKFIHIFKKENKTVFGYGYFYTHGKILFTKIIEVSYEN